MSLPLNCKVMWLTVTKVKTNSLILIMGALRIRERACVKIPAIHIIFKLRSFCMITVTK